MPKPAVHGTVASLGQSVQTATESLRLTRLRYTAGEATVLEVVDAQNTLTTAEIHARTAPFATNLLKPV